MELEKDCWYWASDPREGDIFYPLFVVGDGYVLMDGKHYKEKDIEGLNLNKAIMPIQS